MSSDEMSGDKITGDEMSYDEMSGDEISVWLNDRVTKCPCDQMVVTKCPVTKCPPAGGGSLSSYQPGKQSFGPERDEETCEVNQFKNLVSLV